MSTRSSIAYTEKHHLYLDVLDNNVYLEWNNINQIIILFTELEWAEIRGQIIHSHESWEKIKARIKELEEANDNCISRLLHESRMREVETENAKFRKALMEIYEITQELQPNSGHMYLSAVNDCYKISTKALG